MSKPVPKIADSEWRIMKLLWKKSPRSAREIIDEISEEVDWTPKTIKTLLNRLVGKSALDFEKEGRSYLYYPKINEKQYKQEETRTFVNRVFDGALKPMLAAFLEDNNLSQQELDELRKILDNGKGEDR